MFSNKSVNNKVLAVAFVSMLMICSLGMMFTEESDAAYDQTFDIYMREGDQFSYTPAVNLSGNVNIVATESAFTGDHLNWSSGETWTEGATISGNFATFGEYKLVLTATWTGGSDSSLTQTAKQTINFHVYDRLAFTPNTGSESYTIDDVNAIEDAIDNIRVDTSSNYAGTVEYSHQITFNGGSDNGLFAYNDNTGDLTVAGTADADDVGQYVITITADYADGTSHAVTDSAVFTYTIDVGADLTVTGGSLETYVGNSNTGDNTFEIETNYPEFEGFEYTVTNDSGVDGIITWAGSTSNTFSVNTNATGIATWLGEAQSKTFNVTVQVSGDVDNDDVDETAQTTVSVTIFAGLEFTSEPTISNGSVQSATGNALDALATANFEGATKITYNWGDGTTTTVNVTPDSGSKFSARHVYSQAGTYAITITAENDKGDMRAYMLYDATNGAWAEGTEDDVPADGEKTFFEEHGILFLIFAVLAILMFILFFVNVFAPYTLIAGIIFVIAAVAFFIGADFGLTEGLIEDLNI